MVEHIQNQNNNNVLPISGNPKRRFKKTPWGYGRPKTSLRTSEYRQQQQLRWDEEKNAKVQRRLSMFEQSYINLDEIWNYGTKFFEDIASRRQSSEIVLFSVENNIQPPSFRSSLPLEVNDDALRYSKDEGKIVQRDTTCSVDESTGLQTLEFPKEHYNTMGNIQSKSETISPLISVTVPKKPHHHRLRKTLFQNIIKEEGKTTVVVSTLQHGKKSADDKNACREAKNNNTLDILLKPSIHGSSTLNDFANTHTIVEVPLLVLPPPPPPRPLHKTPDAIKSLDVQEGLFSKDDSLDIAVSSVENVNNSESQRMSNVMNLPKKKLTQATTYAKKYKKILFTKPNMLPKKELVTPPATTALSKKGYKEIIPNRVIVKPTRAPCRSSVPKPSDVVLQQMITQRQHVAPKNKTEEAHVEQSKEGITEYKNIESLKPRIRNKLVNTVVDKNQKKAEATESGLLLPKRDTLKSSLHRTPTEAVDLIKHMESISSKKDDDYSSMSKRSTDVIIMKEGTKVKFHGKKISLPAKVAMVPCPKIQFHSKPKPMSTYLLENIQDFAIDNFFSYYDHYQPCALPFNRATYVNIYMRRIPLKQQPFQIPMKIKNINLSMKSDLLKRKTTQHLEIVPLSSRAAELTNIEVSSQIFKKNVSLKSKNVLHSDTVATTTRINDYVKTQSVSTTFQKLLTVRIEIPSVLINEEKQNIKSNSPDELNETQNASSLIIAAPNLRYLDQMMRETTNITARNNRRRHPHLKYAGSPHEWRRILWTEIRNGKIDKTLQLPLEYLWITARLLTGRSGRYFEYITSEFCKRLGLDNQHLEHLLIFLDNLEESQRRKAISTLLLFFPDLCLE